MVFFVPSLCWVFQLSEGVFVESEGLFRFSAGVVEGHLRDVLVPEMKERIDEYNKRRSSKRFIF